MMFNILPNKQEISADVFAVVEGMLMRATRGMLEQRVPWKIETWERFSNLCDPLCAQFA